MLLLRCVLALSFDFYRDCFALYIFKQIEICKIVSCTRTTKSLTSFLVPMTSVLVSSVTWRTVIQSEVNLDAVISVYFAGDPEFTKAVVDTIDSILTSGDIHKWADLKRFDAHASKHQKISPDYLLNLTSVLMNRVCSLSGPEYCTKYKDILYDRIENFHNQCREEIPQSVSRHRAKFEYLYSYNAKTYMSILQLVTTFLLKSEFSEELGKRIASNHNHWFNFVHIIEFLKSLTEGVSRDSPGAIELWTLLSPLMFQLVAGMCGLRMGRDGETVSVLEKSGVEIDGWIGSVLIDAMELFKTSGWKGGVIGSFSSCLNALASLQLTGLGRSLINQVVELITEGDWGNTELMNFFKPKSDSTIGATNPFTPITIESLISRIASGPPIFRVTFVFD